MNVNNAPQFSLRWNNYVSHVTDAFNILRLENDLVDVTLCCDGGKIKAHKVLLSVCSAYFRQVFKETPCQHPVIVFKNVRFDDLNAIINFMYHGEVNIFQEQLESFLITAELLEVKGLTDNVEDEHSRSYIKINSDETSLDLTSKSLRLKDNNNLPEEPINLATIQVSREEHLPLSNVPRSFLERENLIGASMQFENMRGDETSSTSKLPVFSQIIDDTMQVDNQNVTPEDLSEKNSESDLGKFRCQLCPKGFKHPTSLTLHKDSHAGKTQCPVCHRSFSRSYDMRSHLQRIHQGKQLTIKEIRYKTPSETAAKQFNSHNI
ncbi:hypothetical protein EVAR_53118_1 [Eumeta japonica]|uniref:Broad-complex core protein n=1 Tax=Eumeta variegata TaxID=151549 RepID=A0A4C1YAZ3_EUMVA|nr:hypothetical protein EVAR_53118_1 [Eumeta japonica]